MKPLSIYIKSEDVWLTINIAIARAILKPNLDFSNEFSHPIV
jgi:hypothetical protein